LLDLIRFITYVQIAFFQSVDNNFSSHHRTVVITPSTLGIAVDKNVPRQTIALENLGGFNVPTSFDIHGVSFDALVGINIYNEIAVENSIVFNKTVFIPVKLDQIVTCNNFDMIAVGDLDSITLDRVFFRFPIVNKLWALGIPSLFSFQRR